MQVDDEKCNRATDIVVAEFKRERRGEWGGGGRCGGDETKQSVRCS